MKPNLKEHLKFERLLTELFATFVNVTQSNIDERFDKALEQIGRMLLLDGCLLALFDETTNEIEIKNGWINEKLSFEAELFLPQANNIFNLKEVPWITAQLLNMGGIEFSSLDDIPVEAIQEQKLYKKMGFKSASLLSLVNNDKFLGALGFGRIKEGPVFSPELVLRLKIVADVFVQALLKIEADKALSESNRKLMEMKDQIESERNYLQEEISNEHNFENIIGQNHQLCSELNRLEKVAVTDATVLILGETGTGKELFSRAVHSKSKRSHHPLIKVNCASLPSNLIEDELFGHEKGAFTGAHTSRKGRFELADRGTIFLDEIGELPVETQGKLLNVLQEGEFERLGSARTIRVDVRIIAATNRDLEKEVDAGRFREDLFYRLNKIPIVVPPLRNRIDDIPYLVDWIVKKAGPKMGKKIVKIPVSTIESLQAYSWPGNVRELENVIENAIIYSVGGKLTLPTEIKPYKLKSSEPEQLISGKQKKLAEMNHDYIKEILISKNWKIEGSDGAAKTLGLPPSTLRNKMNKYGIKRNKHDYTEPNISPSDNELKNKRREPASPEPKIKTNFKSNKNSNLNRIGSEDQDRDDTEKSIGIGSEPVALSRKQSEVYNWFINRGVQGLYNQPNIERSMSMPLITVRKSVKKLLKASIITHYKYDSRQ